MNKSISTLEPITAIYCDDIRQEISGKQILIGVYSEHIIVQSVPAVLGLCFFIQFRVRSNKATKATIRITDTAGQTAGEATIDFKRNTEYDESDETTGYVALPQLPISIMQVGTINIYWSSDGTRFSLIEKKMVKTGPVATAWPPPAAQSPPAAPGS